MSVEQALQDFEQLCEPTSIEELARLRQRLGTHVDVIAEAALQEPDLPVDLAERLADGLRSLVALGASLDSGQRALVRGALLYFLLTGDADNDVASPHGLADDVHVFNEACRRLGIDRLRIML